MTSCMTVNVRYRLNLTVMMTAITAVLLIVATTQVDPVHGSMPKHWFKLKNRVRNDRFNNLPIRGRYRNNETLDYYQNANKARIIKSSHFESKYVLGQKIVFICVAEGQPRPTITWKKDGKEISMHKFLKLSEWQIGETKLKSKMEIDPASQMDKGIYQCFADNIFAIDIKAFRTSYGSR